MSFPFVPQKRLVILLVLVVSGCGYQWTKTHKIQIDACEIGPIINYSVDRRASGLARRILEKYVSGKPCAHRKIHLTILPFSTSIRGVDANRLGAVSKVEVNIQLKVTSGSAKPWVSPPVRAMRYFPRGATGFQSRIEKQDAFGIALETAIVDAIGKYRAHVRSQ